MSRNNVHAVTNKALDFYWVARMANPVEVCVYFYWVAKPSRNLSLISSFFYFSFSFFLFFSVSVKVLPVTPLLSGVFVHRAFYAYFLRIQRVVGNA